MNEQVKQLMIKHGLHKHISEDCQHRMEMLAKLIVQECIKQVEPTQHHKIWAQSYLGGVDGLDLLYSKINDIKKHFGVEECSGL